MITEEERHFISNLNFYLETSHPFTMAHEVLSPWYVSISIVS